MKKLEELVLGVSPLTDRIRLGKLTVNDREVFETSVDFTSKFLGALITWVPPGNIRTFKDSKGGTYEVEVRQVSS